MKQEDIVRMGEALFHASVTHEQIDPPSVNFPEIDYEDAWPHGPPDADCVL